MTRTAKQTSKTAMEVIRRALNHQNNAVAALRAAMTHDLSQVDSYNVSTCERAGVALSKQLTAIVERR